MELQSDELCDLESILPADWEYTILQIIKFGTNPIKTEVKLKIAIFSEEEVKLWIRKLEINTSSTYSIRSTEKTAGLQLKFKQRLHCCFKTRSKRMSEPNLKCRTRNTNCCSSLSIAIHTIRKKFRGKIENTPDPKKPCIIHFVATHNHDIFLKDSVRFNRVSDNVKENLLKLYHSGHTPASALETIKMDIQLSYENYEEILTDRRFCPDYNFCYYIYKSEFKKQFASLDFNDKKKLNPEKKKFLTDKLEDYNKSTGETSALFFSDESDYVIALCPPLFKRIHKYIQEAGEIVFMNSTGTVDHDDSRIYFLLTLNEAGGLPLGIIITSSENSYYISKGFQMLKDIVGNDIFYGNSEGPQVFMTDDSEAEHIAIRSCWTNSKILLCIFHVLQSFWKWLINSENKIFREDAVKYFQNLKSIIYAPTNESCETFYAQLLSMAGQYQNFINYITTYWERRDVWTMSNRVPFLTRENSMNDIAEASMRIMKAKILSRVKTFNIIQLTDFYSTKYVQYYEKQLLDLATNHQGRCILWGKNTIPPVNIVEKIKKVDDNIFLVPTQTKNDLFYMVNMDVLSCVCIHGNIGKWCKHIEWLQSLSPELYIINEIDFTLRSTFHKIATGKEKPDDQLSLSAEEEECEQLEDQIVINSKKSDDQLSLSTEDEECDLDQTVINSNVECFDMTQKSGESDLLDSLNLTAKIQTSETSDDKTSLESVHRAVTSNEIKLTITDMLSKELNQNSPVEDGGNLIQEISELLNEHLGKSPTEVVPALKILLGKTRAMKNTNAFASACATFGTAHKRKTESEISGQSKRLRRHIKSNKKSNST